MVDYPQCGARFRKVNKWHTFCRTGCKDAWHNGRRKQKTTDRKILEKATLYDVE